MIFKCLFIHSCNFLNTFTSNLFTQMYKSKKGFFLFQFSTNFILLKKKPMNNNKKRCKMKFRHLHCF